MLVCSQQSPIGQLAVTPMQFSPVEYRLLAFFTLSMFRPTSIKLVFMNAVRLDRTWRFCWTFPVILLYGSFRIQLVTRVVDFSLFMVAPWNRAGGALKTRDWKTRNWKTRHQTAGLENARLKNARTDWLWKAAQS